MADKKIFCSVVLKSGMEYMVNALSGWEKGVGATFVAETIDGKPIVFGMGEVSLIREVTQEEFEVWKKSLEEYREKKMKEAKEQVINNIEV